MKIKVKYLISLFICLLMLTLGSKVYAVSIVADKKEIKIGETTIIRLEDKKTTTGIYTTEYTPIEWSTASKGIIEITSNSNVAEIKGLHEGTVTIKVKCKSETYTGTGEEKIGPRGPIIDKSIISTATVTLEEKITVLNESKEIEDLGNKVNDANQTITDLEEAYKYIPKSTASAETIDRFISSDAEYNGGKRINSITNKELLEAWETTIKSAMIDTISKDMYKDTLTAIQDRIYDREVSETTLNNLSNKMKNAIDATQKTVEGYKKQILQIQMDLGKERTDVEFTDVLKDIENYIPTDEDSDGKLEGKVSIILTVITNIGMVLAILMVAIIGIKYMLGSVEEKAEYKKDMIPYLVGACLLFGITVIVKVLQQIGQTINNI